MLDKERRFARPVTSVAPRADSTRSLERRTLSAAEAALASEFTAILERDGEWFVAYSPEIPGANGQGKNKEEALDSLSAAISLILEDRREDGLRGIPPDAIRETVTVK